MLSCHYFDLLNNLHHPLSPHYLLYRDAADCCCCRSDDDDWTAYHRARYSRGDWVRTFATVTSPRVERFLRHSRRWRLHTGSLISRPNWSVKPVRWMTIESSRGSKILTSAAWLSFSARRCSCSLHWLAHLSGDDTCKDSLDSCRDMVHQMRPIPFLISSIPLNLAALWCSCSSMCWSSLSSSDDGSMWRRSREGSQAMGMFLYLLEMLIIRLNA